MIDKLCDSCGKSTPRKQTKKIKKKYLCLECYRENRLKRRKENTQERIKERIKERRIERTIKETRKCAEVGNMQKTSKNDIPKIKGSKIKRRKNQVHSISSQEKYALFKILINRGMDGKEAGERIKELIEAQSNLRIELKKQNKTNEEINDEIKIKQQELLEELWRY